MGMDEVTKILDREKRVKLAYLFGSAARNEMTGLSDVDIGVYLDKSLSSDERFKLRLELISELESALGSSEVDLVVMNDSPILLNYNIIKRGKLIKSEMEAKVRFETDILSRYLDRKYYIDRHTSLGMKRIAEGGL